MDMQTNILFLTINQLFISFKSDSLSFNSQSTIFYTMSRTLLTLLILAVFLNTAHQQTHQKLQLETPYPQEFKQFPMIGRYVFDITEEQVKKLNSDRWFFFVQVQPDEDKEWIYTQIQLSVGEKDKEESTPVKKCDAVTGGVDSCFLTNKQFKYKTETVHVRVTCRGSCKFKLSAEISAPYKIQPGKTVQLDFQNTAYSKVFTLDTTTVGNFDQLRIILRPQGFLKFAAPIGLYLNQDNSVPTQERHDLKGITLWDNGQGIFLDQPDARGVFTILIEGPQKNVLLLETQLLSLQKTNDLSQDLPFFDYLGDQSSKKYKVKVNPKKGICLQMTTFSGAIKLTNIYDQNLKKIDQQFTPLSHTYSELEYQLDSSFFTKNSNKYKISEYIVFEIEGVKESTFVLEPYQLNSAITHLIPQRTRYVKIPNERYHQYYVEIVQLETAQFEKSTFQVILTTSESKQMTSRFFNCKKQHGKDCQLKSSQVALTTIKNDNLIQSNDYKIEHLVNGVQIFKFSIPASKFVKSSPDTKKYILTILLENKLAEQQLYTIQFLNSGHSVYLKQGEVKTDRVAIDESKYYTFTNTNKDVKQIRAHIMQISGRVFMEGYWKDPQKHDLNGQQILDYHNSVQFQGVKENQTIYLKITGKDNAYFSIQLQLVKDGEFQWWNHSKQDKGKGKGFNEIIIIKDIAYQFNIKAKSKEVFQIHSNEKKFTLDINSHLPLEICMTEDITKPPFPDNCQVTENLSKNLIFDVMLERGNIGNVGVTNNNQKDVKFNIRFTTNGPNPIDDKSNSSSSNIKCLVGVLGKINKYNFKKDSSSCYSYFLERHDDLEVMVDIISDQYDLVNVLAEINGVQKVEIIGATHIFKKEELKKACGTVSPCPVKIFIDSKVDSEIRFTTQFTTGTFFLLDGIANQFTGTSQSRNFVYELYNKINTTVILENKNGFYKFYGKIVEANSYWSGNEKFPTEKDKIIESSNPFYYLFQISVLTQNQIVEAKCKECLLLLTVAREKGDDGQKSKFVIQCTQQDRYLKENQPVFSYIAHRSMTFFEFYNPKNSTILLTINSQNQECVEIYAKKGLKARASASDYDKKSQNSNMLIIENANEGEYSIALNGLENCYFSIDVTTSPNETLSTIQQGHYKDIQLDIGQISKFIYENKNDEVIKILTLHVNGEITISAKAYPNVKALMQDTLKKNKFSWSGQDFLRIEKDDPNYCTNCVYLIVLKASKQTKTSIMITAPDSEFPIVMDSTIKDELKKNEIEKLRIFTQRISQFEVNIQYGQIQIDILTSHTEKVEFSKIYKTSQSTQYQNITSNIDDIKTRPINDYSFMQYNKIRITALKDSGFSFGFITDREQSKRGNKVKYGAPEYISLISKKRECLRGTINDGNEQFLISITGEKQNDYMNNIEISCLVGKELLNLNKDIAKNEMIVTVENPPKTLPASYEFCMLSKDDIFLTFIHSSHLNYFPQSQAVMVSKEMNLSFYSQGKNIIEINECTSRAIVSISNSFNNLGSMNSEIQQVRKTNNVIEFNYYGPVFVHVEADSATIAWRKKEELSKLGFGYDQYTTNKIRIDKVGGELKVDVYPLKRLVSNSKLKMMSVEYKAFIAYQEMNLYEAMNCKRGAYLQSSVTSNTEDATLSLKFDIPSILTKFKKKYVLIGVLAVATSNLPDESTYRFIYPYQQILTSGLNSQQSLKEQENEIQINPIFKEKVIIEESSDFNTFVLIFTFIVAGGFLGLWVYRKCIKKLLKKRRQQLSEQGTGDVRYQEFTSYT